MGALIEIDFYSRKGCHLCEIAMETIESALVDCDPVTWQINHFDVDLDQELKAKYGDKVPVIFLNKELFSYYGVNKNDFEEALKKFD